MEPGKILLVEDDKNIRKLLELRFRRENFVFQSFKNGYDILAQVGEMKPDLIILDVMLPFKHGFDILKEIRSQNEFRNIPVFFLTAKTEEEDILKGLALGADDYIKKPFSPKELLARAKNVISRSRQQQRAEAEKEKLIVCHDISLNPDRLETRIKGLPVNLTLSEHKLMEMFCKNPGFPYERSAIIDSIRGSDYIVTERTVDVMVSGLRKKIKDSECRIVNVRGIGYKLVSPC